MADSEILYFPDEKPNRTGIIALTVISVILLLLIIAAALAVRFVPPYLEAPNGTVKIIFLGDVMVGERIDKLFDPHNYDASFSGERDDEAIVQAFRQKYFPNKAVPYKYIWGDTLPYLSEGVAKFINLETPITTYSKPWPNRDSFRMHPANIPVLLAANITFCNLANDRILDYMSNGLLDTTKALTNAGIYHAGAGANIMDAVDPAVIEIGGRRFGIFSFADTRTDWAALFNKPGFNYVNIETLSSSFYADFDNRVRNLKTHDRVDVIIFSMHWGPSWGWYPTSFMIDFAHHLIDESEVDLVFGHSSHNVQGIEIYKGKPIIYGAGDFINDYAVDPTYRNDLGFIYGVNFDLAANNWVGLDLVPVLITPTMYQVNVAKGADADWLLNKMSELSGDFGTVFNVSENGRLVSKIIY